MAWLPETSIATENSMSSRAKLARPLHYMFPSVTATAGFSQTVVIALDTRDALRPIVADFNRDGKLDIATSNHGSGTITIVLGTGAGTFSSPMTFDSGGSSPASLAARDFNNDGKLDLAVLHWPSNAGLAVLFGDGAGGFFGSHYARFWILDHVSCRRRFQC